MARYLAQIDDLSATLQRGGYIAGGTAAKTFRELVQSVVVHPVSPKAPLQIEVRGYLAELTRDEGMKPSCRLSGYSVVAEDRYGHKPHMVGPLFSVSLAA